MGAWRGIELDGLGLAEPTPGDLRLRPYRESDVTRAFAAMQDRSMHEFLALPDPYTEADAREFCLRTAPGRAERGEGVELAMVGADDEICGGAGLTLPGARATGAEIGYVVHAGARGRGLATRATRLLTAWAFAHGVARVEIRAATGNAASQHVAMRAGFRFEGLRRADVLTGAGVADSAVFVRLPRDPSDVAPWMPPLGAPADDRVLLRVVEPGDHGALAAELRDPESLRWMVGPPPTDPDAGARARAAASALGWLVGPASLVAVSTARAAGWPGTYRSAAGRPVCSNWVTASCPPSADGGSPCGRCDCSPRGPSPPVSSPGWSWASTWTTWPRRWSPSGPGSGGRASRPAGCAAAATAWSPTRSASD